ncbi:MAG: hypothetical protein QNJ40_26395 [Xanthomonadales bacterium]|nr:hypothetical protein [Xanthomonadales bacterium]
MIPRIATLLLSLWIGAGAWAAANAEVRSSLQLLHKLAAQGDADAQYGLGTWYARNHMNDLELSMARDWLIRAARQQHVHAMFRLGVLLASVDSIRNDAQAIDWVSAAADAGLVEAVGEMGMFHFEGFGHLERDCGKATELLERAYGAGDDRAESNLVWVLSTCPEQKHRDGSRALRMAFELVYRKGEKTANTMDNLAAAYAEAGDFLSAEEAQREAIEMAESDEVRAVFELHLESYLQREAWRDETP